MVAPNVSAYCQRYNICRIHKTNTITFFLGSILFYRMRCAEKAKWKGKVVFLTKSLTANLFFFFRCLYLWTRETKERTKPNTFTNTDRIWIEMWIGVKYQLIIYAILIFFVYFGLTRREFNLHICILQHFENAWLMNQSVQCQRSSLFRLFILYIQF